jgi:hypothetical protein
MLHKSGRFGSPSASKSTPRNIGIIGSKSELLRTLAAASSAKTAGFGVPSFSRSGAPRSMKMGNIPSPWRYDTGTYHTPERENTRPVCTEN